MKKILILGGTGFIGRNLINFLNNYKIFILTRKKEKNKSNVKYILGDLNKINSFNKKILILNPDIIINLYWQDIPNFNKKNSIKNLLNTINFFELIFQNTNCKKIINIGSCLEYSNKKGKCKEFHETKSYDYFSLSKNTIREYLSYKCRNQKISLIWLRPFYLYGPYQRKESLIPSLIDKCISSDKIIFKSNTSKLDFIHVYDLCDAIMKFIKLKKNTVEVFNIGSGKSISINKIVMKVVKKYFNSNKLIFQNCFKNDSVNFYSDNSKVKKYINWEPKKSIDDGINQAINFTK